MSSNLKYKTNSLEETQKIAKELAENILKNKKWRLLASRRAFIIALKGNIGSGKTTFLQGFVKGLRLKEKITSPTFNIYKNYQLKDAYYGQFYHFDCYRIEKYQEILELGFEKIISDPKNIVAVEWPEKIKNILPKNILWIKFKFINKTEHSIDILPEKRN